MEQQQFCPHCGVGNPLDSRFCKACGATLIGAGEATSPSTLPTQPPQPLIVTSVPSVVATVVAAHETVLGCFPVSTVAIDGKPVGRGKRVLVITTERLLYFVREKPTVADMRPTSLSAVRTCHVETTARGSLLDVTTVGPRLRFGDTGQGFVGADRLITAAHTSSSFSGSPSTIPLFRSPPGTYVPTPKGHVGSPPAPSRVRPTSAPLRLSPLPDVAARPKRARWKTALIVVGAVLGGLFVLGLIGQAIGPTLHQASSSAPAVAAPGTTDTASATDTPVPINTATATSSPKSQLEALVRQRLNGTVHFDALPSGQQDPDRLRSLTVDLSSDNRSYDVSIVFTAQDPGFSILRDTVHKEMRDMAKDLFQSGVPISSVTQVAWFALADKFGKTSVGPIDETTLDGATGQQINWDNVDQIDFKQLWQETPYNKEFSQ